MRWYRAELCASVQIGTDATRNPICEVVPTGRSVLVRTAPWARTHVAVDGNGFNVIERTYLTKSPASAFEGIAVVMVAGESYGIEHVTRDGPQTAVKVRRCDKPWESS